MTQQTNGVADDMLFGLPVEVRRCRCNSSRLVIVSPTREALLRTLDVGLREREIAELFVRAMNEWAGADLARLRRYRFGTSPLRDEDA